MGPTKFTHGKPFFLNLLSSTITIAPFSLNLFLSPFEFIVMTRHFAIQVWHKIKGGESRVVLVRL
uniref:Putative ovule protein n=1 Tax=Solanum chacoense TaxID=4108 RepID=A0A0V0GQK8_SOLCH